MRKLITQLILALPLLALLFCVPEVNAQRMQGPLVLQDFETSVRNIVVSTTGTNANRRFTFELYLLDTDPEQQLVLAGYQAGVYINPGIFPAGATISVGIVPGSSQLSNTAQVPQAIEYDPVQSTINLAGRTPPGPGEVIDEFTYIPAGSIISTAGLGTRIIRIQVSSTLVFTPNSLANLMFNSSEVVTPNYASRVSHYDDTNMLIVWDPDLEVWTWSPNVGGVPPLNVQLTVTPGAVGETGTNAHVYGNPVLNPQAVDPATANAGPDQGICAGQTATLAGVVGGCATGGIWSGGTGTFSPNNTTLNAVYTPGAGEASATLTLTSTGCTPAATDNVVITITALPATPNAGTDMTVCVNGGLVTLTGLPAGGTWTGFGVTPEGVFDPANGTQTLTYTVSNSCGSAGDDVLVTVTQLPATPNAGTDMTVCVNGGLVTLTGLPAGGTWTGFGVTPEGVFDPANGTQTLTYTVSNSCGSAGDNVIVNVTQLPATPNAGTDMTVCVNGGLVTLTGLPAGGTWTGFGVTPEGVFDPANGTQTLTYTVSNSCGSAGDDVLVTVTQLPATPNAGTDMTVCVNGGLVTLTGLPAGGTWTGFGVTPEGVFDPSNGNQTLTYTVSNSCGSASDDVIVTVTQLPIANAGPDLSACILDADIQLVGTPAGGVWSGVGVTPGGVFDPSAGTSTLTYTVTNGCGSDDDAMTVNVTSAASANAGADLTACSADADITLTGSPAGGEWSGFGVTPEGVFDPSVGTSTLTYSVTTGCGSASDDMTVTVTNAITPVVTIVASANPVEELTSVTFTATAVMGTPVQYLWTVDGTPSGTNNFEFTYVPENGDLVQVQMLVSETCVTVPYDDSNIITMEVTSIPIPLAAEWTGNANDQDWATAGNWDVLAVPGAITNVTIPGGLGDNYPETAGVCNNLTIENGGSVMVNPTVGGTVNVESLITGEQYHYISSPVASAQAGINLFNLATYMRAYDETEATTQWENLYYTDYLVPFTGYSVFSPASVGDQTVSYSAGGLNSGDWTKTNLTFTGNSTEMYDGYNLVGNPYASRLDLETGITRVNVGVGVYFWNPSLNGGAGDYAVYTIGGSGTNGASANVAVGQGFFVKVMSEGTGTFGVSEASRTNAVQAFFKSSLNNVVRLHVAGDVYSDETVVLFNTQATNQFDSEFDAYKLKASEVNHMYTKTSDGSELAINTLTSIEQNTSVPVYFEVAHSGMYNITASELETIAGNIPVWLEDLKTGTVQNLRENAVYSFNANVNDNANRFKLTFATLGGVDDKPLQNVNIWSVDKNIHMQLPVVVKGNVRVTNAAGQTLLNNEINAVGEYVIHAPVAAGVYMVTITSNEGTVTKKVFIK